MDTDERPKRHFYAEVHSLVSEAVQIIITIESTVEMVLEEYNTIRSSSYTRLYFDGVVLSPDAFVLSLTFPYFEPVFLHVDSPECLRMLEDPLMVSFLENFVGLSRFRRTRKLRVFRFGGRRWDRVHDETLLEESAQHVHADRVRLALFNVLFDCRGDEKIKKSQIRHSIQLHHLLPRQNADIYVLNEVTQSYVRNLRKIDWCQEGDYWMTGGDSISEFGSLVLSRIPILSCKTFGMRSQCKRPLLVVELANGMVLCVCHLKATSTMPDFEFSIRKQQILEISRHLIDERPGQTWMLVGDTNFDREDLPDYLNETHGWMDQWPIINPDSPGFTYDPSSNLLIPKLWPIAETPYRFDRVLLSKRGVYKTVEMSLFARSKVRARGAPNHLFPSDHFGVLSVLARKTEMELAADNTASDEEEEGETQ